jgi:HAD superfamily hydrolase (TIGR01509 family)
MLIIFDADGTLVDTEVLGNEVLCELANEAGLDMTVEDCLREFRGRRLEDTQALMSKMTGRPMREDFIPEYRVRSNVAFEHRTEPMPGALALVHALSHEMCIASGGPHAKMDLTLAGSGLRELFDGRIFSSYDVQSWKPEPGVFLHAAKSMGFAPEDCVVVEDSPVGFQAGLAAGMRTIAYQPHGLEPDLPDGVEVVRHLAEINELI